MRSFFRFRDLNYVLFLLLVGSIYSTYISPSDNQSDGYKQSTELKAINKLSNELSDIDYRLQLLENYSINSQDAIYTIESDVKDLKREISQLELSLMILGRRY